MEKMENSWRKNNLHKDDEQSLLPMKPGTLGGRIAEGTFSNVHDVNNIQENIPKKVVKIGIVEDFKPPLAKWLKISFSREKAEKFLKGLLGQDFDIVPDEEMIKNGVAEYMLMKEYFGDEEGKRAELIAELNNPDDPFRKELLSIIRDETAIAKLAEIIQKNKEINFLPKEQTVIGHPPELTKQQADKLQEKKEKLPVTFYIFQEKIEGKTLLDLDEEELSRRPELVEKLLMFSVLTKKMYYDTGKLIDTRPKEFLEHPFEWFRETENIIIDMGDKRGDEKVYFIDTRLLWDKDQKFIGKKGFNFLENFCVRSVDKAIKKYYNLCQDK
jgi:hypothetical protein